MLTPQPLNTSPTSAPDPAVTLLRAKGAADCTPGAVTPPSTPASASRLTPQQSKKLDDKQRGAEVLAHLEMLLSLDSEAHLNWSRETCVCGVSEGRGLDNPSGDCKCREKYSEREAEDKAEEFTKRLSEIAGGSDARMGQVLEKLLTLKTVSPFIDLPSNYARTSHS